MRSVFWVSIFSALILNACHGQTKQTAGQKKQKNDTLTETGFAVVELFTSQGCSSCPPADENLTRILQESKKDGKKVFTLAFHVDYWNRLGWKDPFSKSEYSMRQSMYVNMLNLRGSYTPQMVVNGETEFVGSDKSQADEAINNCLKRENNVRLSLGSPSTIDGKTGSIPYRIEGDFSGKKLCIALIESGKITKVKNGENGGRTLKNDGVVVWFDQVSPENSGNIRLPEHMVEGKKNAELVVFLQDQTTGKIVAANNIVP